MIYFLFGDNSMDIKLRYRFDGSQICTPIGAAVDSIDTPVQVPVGTAATLRVCVISAWTRRGISPTRDMADATAWRFAIFDKYGDGRGLLFATRTVSTDAAGWLVPWGGSTTQEMLTALGDEPARVFFAELQGYADEDAAIPARVLSFPFRVGNRRGDIVAVAPLETFEERDPVAMAALDAHATAGNAHTDIRDAIATHVTDDDNPHAVTASQVGADPAGTAASAVNAHNTSETAHADIRAEKLDKENETTSLSLRQDGVGFIVADTAGAYHATFIPTGITHNVPDSVNHTLSFPSKDGVLALTSDISNHTTNTDNPHAVTEAQVAEASTDDADKAFGRLDSVNIWAQSQAVKPTTISDPISDESTIKSSNVVHLTAVDGGAPSCFLSGIGKSVPSGAIAEVMIVCDNTTAEDQSFTIFFDYGRTISRLFRSDNPMPYNTFSGVPPNGLCIVKVLFWNKRDGDKITIVRDVWRSDWKDDGTNSTMAPMIFDGDGGAWKLLATGDGGMYTIPV